MKLNLTYSQFKKKHISKKNQVIFHKIPCNTKTIENLINNFLIKKNSFILNLLKKEELEEDTLL